MIARMNRLVLAAVLAFAGTLSAGGEEPEADFYVAPGGNDAWTGRLAAANAERSDGPLASLAGARDAVRRLKARGPIDRPIRVLVRGGEYRIGEPVVFRGEDSGREAAPITYAAYPGEKPTISGGRSITGWQRGEGPLWTTVVPAVKQRRWYFRQLFVNERRCIPARSPNEGVLRARGPGVAYRDRRAARRDAATKNSLHYDGDDLQPWSDPSDAIVVVYHSWTTSRHRIASLDTEKKLVRFTAPSGWPMGFWETKQRYYVEFVREHLDAPGEWYLNRRTGVLTYYPRPGEDMTRARVIAPVAEELLRVEGDAADGETIEYLSFEGLSFEHTGWSMPAAATVDGQAAAGLKTAAINVSGARHVAFRRCSIARTGGYALWLQGGSKNNLVRQCHIHDLGAGGVRLGETRLPAEKPRQTERNSVVNCFIHNGGHVYHAGVGVWIGKSSFNKVHHNEICDFFYTGVSVGWSWGYAASSAHHNSIEHNHIHHLGWGQLSDLGGIYCLGDSPGTRLCHNLIHDVLGYAHRPGGPHRGWGLYTDEGSTGILMENNVVYRTTDGGCHQHYGRDNTIRNNILALSATRGEILRSRDEKHRSFTCERNIIYERGTPPLGGSWATRGFEIDRNLYWDASGKPLEMPGGLTWRQWQAKGNDKHSLVADPKFVAPNEFDFRLQPDSPAFKLGFQAIDTATIGLMGEPDWVALPRQVHRPRLRLPGEE